MLRMYDRPTGVFCLETDVFEDEERLPVLLNSLLDRGLVWHWSSQRRYAPRSEYASLALPATRDWTLLEAGQVDTLLADFTEQDINDDRRFVSLVAADGDLTQALRQQDTARQLFSDFARELPPLRLVVVQLGDTGSSHLFVPHRPAPAVRSLLSIWRVEPTSQTSRQPYHQLRLARLESLFNLE